MNQVVPDTQIKPVGVRQCRVMNEMLQARFGKGSGFRSRGHEFVGEIHVGSR